MEKNKENTNNRIILSCPKDAYVSMQHIDKIYDNGVQAVFDFNLDIKKHEFIVFVGPSGCGKSTTLRMIAGLEDISKGHLFIDGEYVNDVTPKDRNIAMVFQSYALYPHMTVFDNMAFSLKINKVPQKILTPESKAQIDAVEKELNDAYKKYRKISKDNSQIDRLASEKENLERDLSTISDDSKKVKFEKKLASLNAKLVNYDSIKSEIKKYDEEISLISKKLKVVQDKATYVYGIDKAKVNDLTKQVEEAKKNNLSKEDIAHLEEQLAKVSSTQVPLIKMGKISKNEIIRRVHEAAHILQIEDYLDRKPKALSGGQRQRVALGRAIVRNAKVFLMDEPLSNLDAKLRVQMRSEIVRLHNQLNATTIYVTHDQTEAMTMATRIVIMKLGHIQQIGTPSEIYSNPSNLFVAGFIGSPAMNFFNTDFENNTLLFSDGTKIKVDKKYLVGKNIPAKVVVGIRPEDIYTVTSEQAKDFKENTITLEVKVSELLGSEYFIHSDFAGKEIILKTDASVPINIGDKIKVCFNLKKLHYFDPNTEKAL